MLAALSVVAVGTTAFVVAPDAYGQDATIEFGSVSVQDAWTTVQLDQSFEDPVVVVGPPSWLGREPAVARVRNVTGSSFDVRVQEWIEGPHRAERVPYVVIEAGTHVIGGRIWHAGHADVDLAEVPVSVADAGFSSTDRVTLASVTTTNDPDAVVPRVVTVTDDGFSLRLREGARSDGVHPAERVAYLVVESGAGDRSDGLGFTAGTGEVTASGAVGSGSAFGTMLPFAQLASDTSGPALALRAAATTESEVTLRAESDAWVADRRFVASPVGFLLVDESTTYAPVTTTTTTPTTQPETTTTSAAPAPPECTNPPADVVIRPGDNAQAIVWSKPDGTVFRFAAGEFRRQSIFPRTGQQFFGSVTDDCKRATIMNGSMLLSSWRAAGGDWVAEGIAPNVAPRTDRAIHCEPGFPRCADPHDLFLNDRPLHHVGSRDNVGPGRWFFDRVNSKVYIGSDPTGQKVELSYEEAAFAPKSPGVTVSGLIIEKYASKPQGGAIGRLNGGTDWKVLDNELRFNHGAGVKVAGSSVVAGNWIHDNGQIGAKVDGNGAVFQNNIVTRNNYAKVLRSDEAGGVKATGTNVRLRNNCVADNDGNGMWGDVQSSGMVFERNVVFRNAYQGIFYEISTGGQIRDNLVGRNGQRWPWLFGAQIMLGTADSTTVTRNIVEVDSSYGNGITVIWGNRPGNNAMRNLVTENEVTYRNARGVSGMRTDFAGGNDVYSGTRYTNNRYHSPLPSYDHFAGVAGSTITLAEQKAAGQETGSTIDTQVELRRWSCDFLAEVRKR